MRSLDNNGKHTQAIQLVTIPGQDHSGTLFARLDASLVRADQRGPGHLPWRAAAGRNAFTGLEIGVIVLALIMAAGCARGVSRRLAEYR